MKNSKVESIVKKTVVILASSQSPSTARKAELTPMMAFFKTDEELLNRYQRLRETGRNLNHRLVKQLPKAALSECGKKLGILKGKTLVFGDEAAFRAV